MDKIKKIIQIVFVAILSLFFVLSIVDTQEVRYNTNFNQDNIVTHIDKLTENGPRSIINKDANNKALEYIVSKLEEYGLHNEDTVEKPAYLIQDFVAEDTRYQNFYLDNIIVHIPANGENKSNEAIMFMGHTDSVPMGNGASDDGVSISVMLEAINYYTNKIRNGYTISNDLVFCFVNGEEYGLYGSKAFMNEFVSFNNVVERIKFGTNLESRGTSGTLIMFETAKNNYNTIQLFSEINQNIFSCSIATMVYDMMPNSTDFSSFKDAYQGLNMANINGGENYHTQNDSLENVGLSYLSQQAQIVDLLIDKLANYNLNELYNSEESAIFFSYLNITTVVYNYTFAIILAILIILLIIVNIVLSIVKNKENNLKKTLISIGIIIVGLLISAIVTYICYFIFQLIAVLFGAIDIHMIGTITYSNIAIVIGIGLVALSITSLVSFLANKYFKIDYKDLNRALAYIHSFLGVVLTLVLKDASYLFVFSGLLLMINELLITIFKKKEFDKFHGELLVTALYFPIVIPVIFLATSALGLKMAYVYGLLFALAIFNVGIYLAPLCKYISCRKIYGLISKREIKVNEVEGSLHILSAGLLVFLIVSMIMPNANVNLQGKQNIAKLPYDDALVYVLDENGNSEYRIYDLNSVNALKKYSPNMEYNGEYYVGKGEEKEIPLSITSSLNNDVLNINKVDDNSLVYLDFTNINATKFTIDDGITSNTYEFSENTYSIKIHSNCIVEVDGAVIINYKEVLRDYKPLIPESYINESNKLHFNLWLTKEYKVN